MHITVGPPLAVRYLLDRAYFGRLRLADRVICTIVQIPATASIDAIARLVREERRRQGMDQQTLALVANVAVRSVHRIEHAEQTVRLDTLLKVLGALGLELTVFRRGQA